MTSPSPRPSPGPSPAASPSYSRQLERRVEVLEAQLKAAHLRFMREAAAHRQTRQLLVATMRAELRAPPSLPSAASAARGAKSGAMTARDHTGGTQGFAHMTAPDQLQLAQQRRRPGRRRKSALALAATRAFCAAHSWNDDRHTAGSQASSDQTDSPAATGRGPVRVSAASLMAQLNLMEDEDDASDEGQPWDPKPTSWKSSTSSSNDRVNPRRLIAATEISSPLKVSEIVREMNLYDGSDLDSHGGAGGASVQADSAGSLRIHLKQAEEDMQQEARRRRQRRRGRLREDADDDDGGGGGGGDAGCGEDDDVESLLNTSEEEEKVRLEEDEEGLLNVTLEDGQVLREQEGELGCVLMSEGGFSDSERSGAESYR